MSDPRLQRKARRMDRWQHPVTSWQGPWKRIPGSLEGGWQDVGPISWSCSPQHFGSILWIDGCEEHLWTLQQLHLWCGTLSHRYLVTAAKLAKRTFLGVSFCCCCVSGATPEVYTPFNVWKCAYFGLLWWSIAAGKWQARSLARIQALIVRIAFYKWEFIRHGKIHESKKKITLRERGLRKFCLIDLFYEWKGDDLSD